MEVINSQITGDLTVTSDTQYNNIIADNVVINEDIVARFYGIIKKDITLKKASIAYLHGKFNGAVKNEGGILYVFNAKGEVQSF